MKVIAYYTEGTGYEQEAKRLQASLDSVGLKYEIDGVPNLGSWQLNTRYKATFIKDKIIENLHGETLLYLDVDAVVKEYPHELENIEESIAVRFEDFKWQKGTCLSGTILIKPNESMLRVCKDWELRNILTKDRNKNLEQDNLGDILNEYSYKYPDFKFKCLDVEYCFIFDIHKRMYPNKQPIIEHLQASRKLKHTV